MTEAELLSEYALRIDRIWSMAQWWASITFAVLLAAHLGVRTLNRPIVSIIILLYTTFTVFVFLTIRANAKNVIAVKDSLLELEELTVLGAQMTGEGGASYLALIWYAILALTYLSTIYYTFYCYLGKKDSNGAAHE